MVGSDIDYTVNGWKDWGEGGGGGNRDINKIGGKYNWKVHES